jgi:cytochrome c
MKGSILGILVAGAASMGAFGVGATAMAQEAGDAAAGQRVFARCLACHRVGPDAANGVGPHLNGVVGRAAGAVEGYEYSEAMANSGITWTEEELHAFLMDPAAKVPGTKMAFPGLKREADLANVIAYLKSFDESGAQAAAQ